MLGRRTVRRVLAGAVAASVAGVFTASSAGADHIHSKRVGNGSCVLLAQKGGEKDVVLPFATGAQVAGRRVDPLHLLVHLGRPGANNAIGVYETASDPCSLAGEYLND